MFPINGNNEMLQCEQVLVSYKTLPELFFWLAKLILKHFVVVFYFVVVIVVFLKVAESS